MHPGHPEHRQDRRGRRAAEGIVPLRAHTGGDEEGIVQRRAGLREDPGVVPPQLDFGLADNAGRLRRGRDRDVGHDRALPQHRMLEAHRHRAIHALARVAEPGRAARAKRRAVAAAAGRAKGGVHTRWEWAACILRMVEVIAVESSDYRVRPSRASTEGRRAAHGVFAQLLGIPHHRRLRLAAAPSRRRGRDQRILSRTRAYIVDTQRGGQRGCAPDDARVPDERESAALRGGDVRTRLCPARTESRRAKVAARVQCQPLRVRGHRAQRVPAGDDALLAPKRATRHGVTTPFMTRDHVHHPADRIRPVERSALRATNQLDAVDRVGVHLRDEQRVRHLDPIEVDLGIGGGERACATHASVLREQARWRALPHPGARHRAIQGDGQVGDVLARERPPVDHIDGDRQRAPRRAG